MRYRCSALAPNVRRFEMDGRVMGLGVGGRVILAISDQLRKVGIVAQLILIQPFNGDYERPRPVAV